MVNPVRQGFDEDGLDTYPILESLSSYLPASLLHRIALDPSPIQSSSRSFLSAALLFADISGFTSLSERLVQRGPHGIEELSRLLNAHFGELIDLVNFYGGDVVKFAGDALLALWQPEPSETDLTAAARRAAQCALSIQAAMHNFEPIPGLQLSLRIGISAGQIAILNAGGVYGRWAYLVTGEPLIQANQIERQASPGQVMLSPHTWELVKEYCQGMPFPELGVVQLMDVRSRLVPTPRRMVNLYPEMSQSLKAFLPGAILSRLAARQSDWVAELRRVSVLFINLIGVDFSHQLDRTQQLMRTIQNNLYHYEGSLTELDVDERGTILVAALGLPPLAHEDDAVRAVQSALSIQAELKTLGVKSAIGIATGRAFCGAVGVATRREYVMIGDVVNLAARLMQMGEANDLLCDGATFQMAHARLAFETLEALKVKGKTVPVIAYRPKGMVATAIRSPAGLIGRKNERTALVDGLQSMLRGSRRKIMIIEGDSGMGKSRLVEELVYQAQGLSLNCLTGAGDAVESASPYHVWRLIFARLFQLDLTADLEARQRHVMERLSYFSSDLEHVQHLLTLSPLLNAVLPLDFPDNEITAQMSGEVRADNTRELLEELLQKSANEAPLVLALEDAHWFDSASWALVWLVSQRIRPMFLVITTRPITPPLQDEYQQLLADEGVKLFRLNPLSEEETTSLVEQRLGIETIPEQVADIIWQKGEGHPLYSQELAYALRDSKAIEITDGSCKVSPHAGDLSELNLPLTLQGLIASRIDRLTPQQQLVLKVASVIGRTFPFFILRDIYPVEIDHPNLAEYLTALEQMDIAALASTEPEPVYLFKHVITQEAVYNLMVYSQRKQLHQAVAAWYERTYASDLTSFFSLLAHHWSKAEVYPNAMAYLEKAGEQAILNYANLEAVRLINEALVLSEQEACRGLVDDRRRARWERLLGEAYYRLGRMDESRLHLERALAFLGWSVSHSKVRLLMSLTVLTLQQILHRFLPGWSFTVGDRERLLEASRTYAQLGSIYFFSDETLKMAQCMLSNINLAERAGVSSELTHAYANLSTTAGLIPWHGLARLYERRAWESAGKVKRLYDLAYVSMVTSMYYVGVADWENVEKHTRQAIDLFERIGDHSRFVESLTVQASASCFAGNIARYSHLINLISGAADQTGNELHRNWSMISQADEALLLGDARSARQLLESVLDMYEEHPDRSGMIRAYGLLGVALLRLGESDLSRGAADQVMRLVSGTLPTIFSTLDGYSGATEVYLMLWQQASLADPRPTTTSQIDDVQGLQKAARQACRALAGYGRIFAIGRPRVDLYRGTLAWLEGNQPAGQRAWLRSLETAVQLKMPYDQGLAHYQLATHLASSDPQKRLHLEQAIDCFTNSGAVYDLMRAMQVEQAEL